MTEQRVRLEGVAATEQYVRVFFTVGDRLAKRVREVKVPYVDLLDAEVCPGIHKEASRRLKALWDLEQMSLPWE